VQHCALAWRALNSDRSTLAGHDSMDDREAEPVAFSDWASSKERFEDPFQDFWRHAAPCVTDGQPDVRTWFEVLLGADQVAPCVDLL